MDDPIAALLSSLPPGISRYAIGAFALAKWLWGMWKESRTEKRDELKETREALKAANDQIRELSTSYITAMEKLNATSLAKDAQFMEASKVFTSRILDNTKAVTDLIETVTNRLAGK
ncbi:hypothetical protein ACFQX4_15545 [Roseomonas sp. GCM10028921]